MFVAAVKVRLVFTKATKHIHRYNKNKQQRIVLQSLLQTISKHDYSANNKSTAKSSYNMNVGINKKHTIQLMWLLNAMEDNAISHLKDIPDKGHKSVLDIACGEGLYCKRAHDLGFKNVVGIDMQETQIARAKNENNRALAENENENENTNRHGILEYYVMNALQLLEEPEFHHRFDVINASWLYSHAKDATELTQFMRAVYQCLKPSTNNNCSSNSIHTGIDINPSLVASEDQEWIQYGIFIGEHKTPKSQFKDAEHMYGRFGYSSKPRRSLSLLNEHKHENENVDNKHGSNSSDSNDDEFEAGTPLRARFYSQSAMETGFRNAGFDANSYRIEFSQPCDWNVADPFVCSLNEAEQKIFHGYVQMGNPQMCGFKIEHSSMSK